MNRRLWIACGTLFLAFAAWVAWKLFPNDEAVIRGRLLQLARKVSFEPGESLLVKTARASQVAELFSPEVTVQLTHTGREQVSLTGRADILQALNHAHLHLRGLQVEFPDVLVRLEPDGHTATALLTAKARIHGESESHLHELKMTLKKLDGQWLITQVEDFKTLER